MCHRKFVSAVLFAFISFLVGNLFAQQTDAPANQSKWTTPTEKEVEAFVENLLQAINATDADKVNELIDWPAMLHRAMHDTDAPLAAGEFRKGFMANIASQRGFAAELINAFRHGGSYTALNVRHDKGYGRTLFRLVLPENGGFNYHDFAVVKQNDGQVRAVDIFVFLNGESFSDTIRRTYLPAAAVEDKQLADRLSKAERLLLQHNAEVKEISAALQSGDFQAVVDEFSKLPAELQSQTHLLILRLMAAQNLDSENFAAAVADFARLDPEDPCMNMLAIDVYMVQQQHDKAIAAIANLERRTENDPFLKLVKSRVYEAQGDNLNAKKLVIEAIKQDDLMLDAYWSLLGFYLLEKDHANTLATLKTIDSKFSIKFNDLQTLPQYKDFVTSKAFADWEKYLKAKTRTAEKQ